MRTRSDHVAAFDLADVGLGWLPDFPDFRDYTSDHPAVEPALQQANAAEPSTSLSTTADLRPWCAPIEHQGPIGSCTAHAAVGLIEYFERKAFGKHIDGSRLFVYKVTRNLLGWTGDRGAFIRSAMGALALFGVPPEEYWPYDVADFDAEPPAFCYALGQSFQATRYYRLDPPGKDRADLVSDIKTKLAANLPSMFGFTVYSSISQAASNGAIPMPSPGDKKVGGHAVMAVGYDDSRQITNASSDEKTTGAILTRNSWGEGWGEGGYGWLPYDYIRAGLAIDWWSVLRSEWIDTGAFKL